MKENNIKALFPEGVETITISKNDYDRLYGQLTYENIVLQSKIDKAIEYIGKYEEYFDKELGLVEMMGAGETRIPVIRTYNLLNILKGEDNIE